MNSLNTTRVIVYDLAGMFAENKEIASNIRTRDILPALKNNRKVILDFGRVEMTTQGFIHALFSDVFREYGPDTLDRIAFKSCNETIRKIIAIVADYMQEGADTNG